MSETKTPGSWGGARRGAGRKRVNGVGTSDKTKSIRLSNEEYENSLKLVEEGENWSAMARRVLASAYEALRNSNPEHVEVTDIDVTAPESEPERVEEVELIMEPNAHELLRPLLVFSHGFMSTRLDSPKLSAHLASHGYVVAAPQFPLSSRNTTADSPDPSDVVNQPGDVSFVLDTLLADPEFATDDVAAGGISLGGMTTLLVGLVPEYRDDRIDVLLPLTPATCLLPADAFAEATPPLLLAHGTSDAILPYDGHVVPFWEATNGPRRLVTYVDGTHTGFADVTEDLLDSSDHADSLGCGQIAGAVGDEPPDGVEDSLNPQCPGVCEDEELGIGMRPTRQGLLTRGIAHAFLDAELGGDEDAALWLDAGVGLQNEDVILEIGE